MTKRTNIQVCLFKVPKYISYDFKTICIFLTVLVIHFSTNVAFLTSISKLMVISINAYIVWGAFEFLISKQQILRFSIKIFILNFFDIYSTTFHYFKYDFMTLAFTSHNRNPLHFVHKSDKLYQAWQDRTQNNIRPLKKYV